MDSEIVNANRTYRLNPLQKLCQVSTKEKWHVNSYLIKEMKFASTIKSSTSADL